MRILHILLVIGGIIIWGIGESLAQSPGGVITNNTLWLKANAGTNTTTNGAAVTAWNDQSPNGFHATTTQNTGTGWTSSVAAPVYQSGSNTLGINFNPSVNFAGAKSLDGAGGMASHQVFAVFNNITTSGVAILGYSDAAGNGAGGEGTLWYDPTYFIHAVRNTTAGNVFQVYGNYNFGSPSTTVILDAQHISTTTGSVIMNGNTLTPSYSNLGTPPAPFSTPGKYRLGKSSDNQFAASPNIAEVISFSRNLATFERQKVTSYLGIKYGMTIGHNYYASNWNGATGTVYWSQVTNLGYNNDITGIARDDASALNQKQSQSINTGLQVVMGNGNTVASDNAANTNNFSANFSALVWGNNAGSVAAWTVTGAPASSQILPRTWKVQETGTVGSVKVQVPDNSGANGLPVENTSVYVLTDADGNFSSGASSTAMTLNGTNWEANIDFTTGQFFTFATIAAEAGTFVPIGSCMDSKSAIIATHNNDHLASNTQRYVLTNAQGVIMQVGLTPSFGIKPIGDYTIYAVNYPTNGVTNLAVGVNIAALSGSPTSYDLTELPIVICKNHCGEYNSIIQQ